jgi:putative ATP-binding cassette transporter
LLLRASKGIVVIVALAGLVAGASHAGLIAIINTTLSDSTRARWPLMLGFAGLCIVSLGCRIVSDALLARLSQDAILNLRMQLCRQILDTPLINLEKFGGSRVMSALTEDVPTIANALVGIPPFFINVATVLGCFTYLSWLSWRMFIVLMIIMFVASFCYQYIMNKAVYYMNLNRELVNRLFDHYRALTQGTKELKIHRRRSDAFLTKELRPTSESLRSASINGSVILAAAIGWGQLMILVGIGLLLFIVSSTDTHALTGFALVTIFLMTPMESIMNTSSFMARANIALKKVDELGLTLSDLATEGKSPLPGTGAEKKWKSLELIGATHAYHREKEETDFAIGPINLSFKPGELVFLVGGNGSGKTTLAKLITGLYTPEEGEIHLDGTPITDANREEYRQLFSVVFSDFYLFESLLGLDTPELDASALKYLTQLHLDHKVEVKEGLLSTTALSQGQRKRLALLTAYLEDRPIYLFDEWAADQDPVFKELFYFQLLPELKARGKTVLVISHDDHYYHVADRIIKMDDGKVEYDKQVGLPGQAQAEPLVGGLPVQAKLKG